jgi:hypothetical protein
LRERDAVSAEVKAVAVKGTWFLNSMSTSVAQGHYAGPAASFGSDMRTLNSARHAVVFGQLEVFVVVFCTFYIIYFLCIYHELYSTTGWKINTVKMSLESLKNSLNLNPLTIKHLPIKLKYYPSSFLCGNVRCTVIHTVNQ